MSFEEPTRNNDESQESGDEQYAAMMERYNQVQEYVRHHLPEGASRAVEGAAMTLMDSTKEDLENEQYWKIGLPERLQLNAREVEQLEAFVNQLKADREWATEEAEPDNSEGEAEQVATGETEAPAEMVDGEPQVFENPAAAYETMQANMEALGAELDTLEAIEDDPYQTLQNFFAILKKHSVRMKVSSGKEVDGLPITISDSHIPQEDWDNWGRDHSKVNSGSISSMKTFITPKVVSEPGFRAENVAHSYYPKVVVDTLNRLFAK